MVFMLVSLADLAHGALATADQALNDERRLKLSSEDWPLKSMQRPGPGVAPIE
jgi:hypothetical protein